MGSNLNNKTPQHFEEKDFNGIPYETASYSDYKKLYKDAKDYPEDRNGLIINIKAMVSLLCSKHPIKFIIFSMIVIIIFTVIIFIDDFFFTCGYATISKIKTFFVDLVSLPFVALTFLASLFSYNHTLIDRERNRKKDKPSAPIAKMSEIKKNMCSIEYLSMASAKSKDREKLAKKHKKNHFHPKKKI